MSLASACSTLQSPVQTSCGETMALLDNVCVQQEVANYVSCVRAHGSELTSEQSSLLSAEAGYFGISAKGASEVSSQLTRKYAVSEQAMLLIIDQCKQITGKAQKKPSVMAPTKYDNPRVDGYALDLCREWSNNCGKPAADAFCMLNGHKGALQYKIAEDSPPTMVISSSSICVHPSCDAISYVVCL